MRSPSALHWSSSGGGSSLLERGELKVFQSRRALADSLNARWLQPDDAYRADCDVLVPCALGGILTHEMARTVQCRIICGAANNQPASDEVAKTLANRGVVYVPDFIANAGGLMYATAVEMHHRNETAVARHVHDGIAKTCSS